MRQAVCSFLCCVVLVAAQAQTARTANGQGEQRPELELANVILNTAVMETESASPDVRAFIRLRVALSLDGDKQKQQQFLPILRELDPDKAEFLVQEKASGGPPREKCDYNRFSHIQTTPAADNTSKPAPASVAASRYAERTKRMVFGCAAMGTCRQSRIEEVLRAINSNLKLKQFERAKAGIEEGFALAAEEWKYDTDPDDSNLWTRNIWPSTENWEAFAILASYVSPDYALDQVKTIPDAAIQLMVRVVLAGYWLGRDPELRPPNIANDEAMGCECVAHYMYIPRHWVKSSRSQSTSCASR